MESTNLCKTCHESKSIKDFVPGFATFYMCKSCAAARQRRKVNCPVCDKSISYGNLSKHKYTHNANINPLKEKMVCDCNEIIQKSSLHYHLLSKRHINSIFGKQLITEE